MKKTILITIVFMLSACGPKGNPLSELKTDPALKKQYIIKKGDSLNVNVWGEPRLSGEVFIREDGQFTLPLIKDVRASGKTVQEVTDLVTEKLKEFIPSASVSISILQSAPIRYFLSGNFLKPGEYRSPGGLTFIQAISTGGGFAPFSDTSKVTLIRQTENGEKRYILNYDKVVTGRQPNPDLKDGDVIVVK